MASSPDLEHMVEVERDLEQGYYHELAAMTVDYFKTLRRGGFTKTDAAAMAGDFHEKLLRAVFGKVKK